MGDARYTCSQQVGALAPWANVAVYAEATCVYFHKRTRATLSRRLWKFTEEALAEMQRREIKHRR
jgi:hypothetical protein